MATSYHMSFVAYNNDSSDQDIQLGYQYIKDFIMQGLLIFT